MTNLVLEILARYMISGIIAYGALFVFLFVRIIVKLCKGTDDDAEIILRGRRLTESAEKQERASKAEMARRYILWPYGVLKILDGYLKNEPQLIRKMNGD